MQIVIDIPEKDYEKILKAHWFEGHDTILDRVYLAIKQGARLPEGHGRLIDADDLYNMFIDGTEGYDCQTWNRIEIGEIIEDAPTIIEKGGDE